MNLNDFLRKLMEDPQSLKRTLEALSQLGTMLDASESGNGTSGAGLVSLLSQVSQPAEAVGQSGPRSGVLQPDQVDRVTYNELFHRNAAVAAALGACDCWGERANCPLCNGEGSPGWVPPDESLFAIYVGPVVHQFSAEAV
jgi:hypothetical protein